jgi:hypothetical protein
MFPPKALLLCSKLGASKARDIQSLMFLPLMKPHYSLEMMLGIT